MNKNFLVVLMIIVAVFAVSGCTSKPATTNPAGAFVGGKEGVAISFLPGAPPAEIPEMEKIPVSVQLQNKGEADVASVKVVVSGTPVWDTATDKMTDTSDALDAAKKVGSQNIPGGQAILDFDASKGGQDVKMSLGPQTATIVAQACYDYQTFAQSTVCITESLTKQTVGATELCKSSGDKTVYSSGAPVQVTGVSQYPKGRTGVTFVIKFKHVGTGTIYNYQSDACPNIGLADTNKITITEAKLFNLGKSLDNGVDCSPNPVALSSTGEGTVTCSAAWSEGEANGQFEDTLYLELSYGYTQQVIAKVKILNLEDK